MEVLFNFWQICVGLALVLYGVCQLGNLKRIKRLERRITEAERAQKLVWKNRNAL